MHSYHPHELHRSCANPMAPTVMCNVTNPQVNVGVWTKMVMKFLERELLACSSVLQLVSVSYQFGETFNVFGSKLNHILLILFMS